MVDQLPPIKTLELDKICRVCLTVKKDMRPLFGEMIAELLMECARIQVMTMQLFYKLHILCIVLTDREGSHLFLIRNNNSFMLITLGYLSHSFKIVHL